MWSVTGIKGVCQRRSGIQMDEGGSPPISSKFAKRISEEMNLNCTHKSCRKEIRWHFFASKFCVYSHFAQPSTLRRAQNTTESQIGSGEDFNFQNHQNFHDLILFCLQEVIPQSLCHSCRRGSLLP